jgi:ABC-type uncharacterized transport system auxiliary subunit
MMSFTRRSIQVRLALVAGAVLLASSFGGCLSGPAPTDHYYRIEASTPAAMGQPAITGTIEVDRLRVEAISQGRRMLYRDAGRPGEVAQHTYHHWADPPNVMLQVQLVEYLRASGVATSVVTPSVHVDSDYRLTGRIVRLERILGSGTPRVVTEIEIALLRNDGNEVLLLETYRDEREAGGGGVGDSVAAFGEAVSSIFGQLVADIPRT